MSPRYNVAQNVFFVSRDLHNAVWLRLSHCKICYIAVSGILSWPKPLLAVAISPLLQLCPKTAGTWSMDGCINSQLETVVLKSTKAIAWEPNKVDSHSVLSICYLCHIKLGTIRAIALVKTEANKISQLQGNLLCRKLNFPRGFCCCSCWTVLPRCLHLAIPGFPWWYQQTMFSKLLLSLPFLSSTEGQVSPVHMCIWEQVSSFCLLDNLLSQVLHPILLPWSLEMCRK